VFAFQSLLDVVVTSMTHMDKREDRAYWQYPSLYEYSNRYVIVFCEMPLSSSHFSVQTMYVHLRG